MNAMWCEYTGVYVCSEHYFLHPFGGSGLSYFLKKLLRTYEQLVLVIPSPENCSSLQVAFAVVTTQMHLSGAFISFEPNFFLVKTRSGSLKAYPQI